ncbi:MAG: hypothetical protein AAGN35_15270 [Bacteroidota bacterium]
MKPKYIIMAGVVLVGLSLVAATAKAAHTGRNLAVALKPRVKPGLAVTTIWIDGTITNPTRGSIEVSDPVIVLSRQGQQIKRLEFSGKTLTISPRSTIVLSDPVEKGGIGEVIAMEFATADLVRLFPAALAAIMGTGPEFVLNVDVAMQVKAPNLPRVSYSVSEPITLRSPV